MPEFIAFVIVSIVVCYGLHTWGFYRGRKIMLFCNKILQDELDEANGRHRLAMRLAERFKQEAAESQEATPSEEQMVVAIGVMSDFLKTITENRLPPDRDLRDWAENLIIRAGGVMTELDVTSPMTTYREMQRIHSERLEVLRELALDNAAKDKRIAKLEDGIEQAINQNEQEKLPATDSDKQQSQEKGE